MTKEEELIWVYELYVIMCDVDVLEMMDPLSPSNMIANALLEKCDDSMLMAIYRMKVPWLAARAFSRIVEIKRGQLKNTP